MTARLIAGLIVTVVGLVLIYLMAAVAGTVWSTGLKASAAGAATTTIYVLSNGFHSDIVLPIENGAVHRKLPISGLDFQTGLADARYLIIGWGSQTAYTSLLALTDMTPGIVVKALLFDRSVMHVQPWSGSITVGEGVYPLELDDDQYERLVEFVAATFSANEGDAADPLVGVSQGYGDVFYRAHPRFSLFYGCNAWTGDALRTAGVPFGIWTPFAQSVEWNMHRLASPSRH